MLVMLKYFAESEFQTLELDFIFETVNEQTIEFLQTSHQH